MTRRRPIRLAIEIPPELEVRLDPLPVPQRCVTCFSESVEASREIDLVYGSRVEYPNDGATWITRKTHVKLRVQFCADHTPVQGDIEKGRPSDFNPKAPGLKVRAEPFDLRFEVEEIWEPFTNQQTLRDQVTKAFLQTFGQQGIRHQYAKAFLDKPVALIRLDFDRPDYHEATRDLNQEAVKRRNALLWLNLTELSGVELPVIEELRRACESWQRNDGCFYDMTFFTLPGPVFPDMTMYFYPPGATGPTSASGSGDFIAAAFYRRSEKMPASGGSLSSSGSPEAPAKLWLRLFLKKTAKSAGLSREEAAELHSLLENHLPAGARLSKREATTEVEPGLADRIRPVLDWIAQRFEK